MSPQARREVLADPEGVVADVDPIDGPGRPVDPLAAPTEELEEAGLRPRTLGEFVGQSQLTEHLQIVIEAALKRNQPVDHLLFAGPPGLGKTSLAGIVAAEMGVGLRVTAGPVLVRAGDLAALLTDLQEGDVLFIDEIHRLHRAVEEILYPAMEDFKLDILIGKGPMARSIRLDLPRFTLVGATTRTGLVAGPLRDRFGFVGRLDHYNADELQLIVTRSAGILGVSIDTEGARRIAERSRGTPRIANRLLRRVRDYVEVRGDGNITSTSAVAGLEVFGVDELGLDKVDRSILDVLCRRFAGRPVGLTTLAQCIGEEPDTIEDAYEPFLLQQGLLQRTTRGRVAAPALSPTSASRQWSRPSSNSRPPSEYGRAIGTAVGSDTMVDMSGPDLVAASLTTAGSEVSMDAYDYGLPESAIAQSPAEPRSSARLLIAPGVTQGAGIGHTTVSQLPGLLRAGDVLVINDTQVLTGRLSLVKATGGRAEVLLLEPIDEGTTAQWEAMVRPGRRLVEGTLLYEVGGDDPVVEVGQVLGDGADGRRSVRLIDPSVVDRTGVMPLPPYIHATLDRPDRYQTVYAAPHALGDRSAAAPTAGLHFTTDLLDACEQAGATVVRCDLAIGLDTFRPITASTPSGHVIHTERYSVPSATMAACREADRVIAVGTTAVRALESAALTGHLSGRTDLYIHGEFPFQVVDVLVTNFHLPRSSLLLLVESFGGDIWRTLYAEALATGYRFLSFGDAMVVPRASTKASR